MKPVIIISITVICLVMGVGITIIPDAMALSFEKNYDWEREFQYGSRGILLEGDVILNEEYSGQKLEVYVKKPGDANRLYDIIDISANGHYAIILADGSNWPFGETRVELRHGMQNYVGFFSMVENPDTSKYASRYLEWTVDCSVSGQTGILNVKEKPFGLPSEDIDSFYYEIQDKNDQIISSGNNNGDLIIKFDEHPKAHHVALHSSQDLIKQADMCKNFIPFKFNMDIRCPSTSSYNLVETVTDYGKTYSYNPKDNAIVYIDSLNSKFSKIPDNYKALTHYSDGSIQETHPDNSDFAVPLKNYDEKLTKIVVTGDGYAPFEKTIDCKITTLSQSILEKQYEQEQKSKKDSEEAEKFCNHLISGCVVSYDVDYRINAPNEFFKKKWTEDNTLNNIKRIDYIFGDKNNDNYSYQIHTITDDGKRISNSGRQTYDMGSVLIMKDGIFWDDGIPYYLEIETMSVSGHSREVAHFWIEEEIDSFAGIGDIRQDYYYDMKTGLLLKMENDRELLDVGGITNADGYKMEATSVNFPKNEGGCLIATATYGSELAPQVQQLRELRDNQLLSTESGTTFMNTFNDVYYSFSPVIADYERENPVFKEMVKVAITPMISSLSILNYVDMDSESSVLGYGIFLIILNVMMYVGIPASVIVVIRKF